MHPISLVSPFFPASIFPQFLACMANLSYRRDCSQKTAGNAVRLVNPTFVCILKWFLMYIIGLRQVFDFRSKTKALAASHPSHLLKTDTSFACLPFAPRSFSPSSYIYRSPLYVENLVRSECTGRHLRMYIKASFRLQMLIFRFLALSTIEKYPVSYTGDTGRRAAMRDARWSQGSSRGTNRS